MAAFEYKVFNETFLGVPTQQVTETSQYQMYPLGTKMFSEDGRVFRYAKAGAVALTPGKLVVAPAVNDSYFEKSPKANAAVGATSVAIVIGTTITANLYKDGFLCDATGGKQYKIASHPVNSGSGGTAWVSVALDEPLTVAITTAGYVTLASNIYGGVVVATAGTTEAMYTGVPSLSVAANYYFWLQTKGHCMVLVGAGGLTVGAVGVSANLGGTSGALDPASLATQPQVGWLLVTTGTSGKYAPFYLTLD